MPDLLTELLYSIYLAIAISFFGGFMIGFGVCSWLRDRTDIKTEREVDSLLVLALAEEEDEEVARRLLESCEFL